MSASSEHLPGIAGDNKQATAVLPRLIAAALAAALLSAVHLKVARPMLLMERFIPGAGWIEIALLAGYAFFITGKMLHTGQSAIWRGRIWRLFSIVFFSQLALGLLGIDECLMTGKLHLPVPALIIAGPIFRGESFFMLFLFLSTVLLVGPAWCSHLCYFGAWDGLAASKGPRPKQLSRWTKHLRLALLIATILVAYILGASGVPGAVAIWIAAAFGLIGVAIMVFWSRKAGYMAHCIVFCPIGLATNIIGKINPFRIRIGDGCTNCRACSKVCRYNALTIDDIKNRKPGLSCTLCGDCISSCRHSQMSYGILGIKHFDARSVFIVMTVAIHAAFLGLARI